MNKITSLHAIKDPNLKQNFELLEAKNLSAHRQDEIQEVIVYFSPSWFRPFNYFKRIWAYFIGLKHIGDFDLVHLNVTYPAGIMALYLKWFKNKRYVITENWTGFRPTSFDKEPFLKRFIIKTILKNASKFLPVSNDLQKQLLRIAPDIKSEIIPNVVNTDIFIAKNNQKQVSKRKQFIHISNLKEEHKNVTGMLNVALRLVKEGYDFEFHIGGNGDWQRIQAFIDKYNVGDRIYTFGRLTYAEVAEKMQQGDCFVLFSNYENQPCVQVEAFASGIGVIATKVGGIA
ncbi:MAG TPA: glycosyltransferase, partial [Chitinophagales bacterium]